MLRYLSTPLKTNKSFSYFVLSRNFSKYFVKSHEWISIEKGVATLGISDYAQSELGEIVHVDLPKIGDKFKSGDSIGAVESVKTAADIYAPVEGVIGEINDKLGKTPSLLNSHAESQGWLVKMKVEEEKVQGELSKMMNEEQYQIYIADLKK